MLLFLLATGGFLFASRRVSLRSYCTSNANCAGCGLSRVCKPGEENKVKSDEEKQKI
jgi:hypothetical protein